MPQSVKQFSKQLIDSGLMAADRLEEFLADVPEEKRPADGEQLARLLVRRKQITPYQAKQVYAGNGDSLVLGNYVILDKLGQGGMGMVLKAEHRRMQRVVALKTLSPEVTRSSDSLARFQREVRAAARLEHPNIVTAYDADQYGDTHFLVMQYVDGEDLSSTVKSNGPLPYEQAADCILQAARGLQYAHEKGVIHRDIKPANLLLDNDGTVKVLDMGLARMDADVNDAAPSELTGTGTVMGTVDYMAPEQAENTKDADERSDIYSLGCTLHYLLTGRATYDGETVIRKILAHRDNPLPSLTDAAGVPWEFDALFRKMIAKQPSERFQSMREVIAELERVASPVTVSDSGPTGSATALDDFLKQSSGDASTIPEQLAETIEPQLRDTMTTAELDNTLTFGTGSRSAKTTGSISRRVWIAITGVSGVLLLLLILWSAGLFSGDKQPKDEPTPTGSLTAKTSDGPEKKKRVVNNQPDVTRVNHALQFDGKDDYVFVPSLRLDTKGPLTFEAWVYEWKPNPKGTRLSGFASFWGKEGRLDIFAANNANWFAKRYRAADAEVVSDSLSSMQPIRHATHVAAVWDGKSIRLFINGSPGKGSSQWAGGSLTPDNPSGGFQIGRVFFAGMGQKYFDEGIVDEVRISRAVRYRGRFTPEKRLTRDKDTLALYHFDSGEGNKLLDSSGNNHHGIVHGATWVKPAASLKQPKNIALQFDGKDDYVEIPTFKYDGSHPITIEATVRPASLKPGHSFVVGDGRLHAAVTAQKHAAFQAKSLNPNPSPQRPSKYNGAGLLAPDSVKVGRLVHLALVIENGGKTIRCFANGHARQSVNSQFAVKPIVNGFNIGGLSKERAAMLKPPEDPVLTFFHGTIEEIRISKVARYRDNYTPESRFTNDKDTLALYHCESGQGAKLVDSSGNDHHGVIHGATWVQPGASPQPVENFALKFDGKTSYVDLPTLQVDLSKPFTFEFRTTIHSKVGRRFGFLDHKKQQGLRLCAQSTKLLHFVYQDDRAEAGYQVKDWPLKPGTYHIAITFDSKLIRVFVDGTLRLQSRTHPNVRLTNLNGAVLGTIWGVTSSVDSLDGTMDEIRFSKVARYTQNFDPVKRLTNDKNTIALYHCDSGRGTKLVDSSGNNHHGVIHGAKWVKAGASPQPENNSVLKFDGKAHLELPALQLDLSKPFTFECVARFDAKPGTRSFLIYNRNGPGFAIFSRDGVKLALSLSGRNTGHERAVANWTVKPKPVHIALTWDTKKVRVYLDGVPAAARELHPQVRWTEKARFVMGATWDGEKSVPRFRGTVDEIRFSTTVRYTARFTPSPRFTPDKQTLALYHCDSGQGTKLIDSSGNNRHGVLRGVTWVRGRPSPSARD